MFFSFFTGQIFSNVQTWYTEIDRLDFDGTSQTIKLKTECINSQQNFIELAIDTVNIADTLGLYNEGLIFENINDQNIPNFFIGNMVLNGLGNGEGDTSEFASARIGQAQANHTGFVSGFDSDVIQNLQIGNSRFLNSGQQACQHQDAIDIQIPMVTPEPYENFISGSAAGQQHQHTPPTRVRVDQIKYCRNKGFFRWLRCNASLQSEYIWWDLEGVPSSIQKNTLLARFNEPPKNNVKHLVLLAAGQQFYPFLGDGNQSSNLITGQTRTDEFKKTDKSRILDVDVNSIAHRLFEERDVDFNNETIEDVAPYNLEDTFVGLAFDARFNFGFSKDNKDAIVRAYYHWLMSKVDVNNLESIYLAGHSRGGALAFRLAKLFKLHLPHVPVIAHGFDPVANHNQDELGALHDTNQNPLAFETVQVFGVPITVNYHKAYKSNLRDFFPNKYNLSLFNILVGSEIIDIKPKTRALSLDIATSENTTLDAEEVSLSDSKHDYWYFQRWIDFGNSFLNNSTAWHNHIVRRLGNDNGYIDDALDRLVIAKNNRMVKIHTDPQVTYLGEAHEGDLTLSWDAIPSADFYKISTRESDDYRFINAGQTDYVREVQTRLMYDIQYKVSAYKGNIGDINAQKVADSRFVTVAADPVKLSAKYVGDKNEGDLEITWNNIPGADFYMISTKENECYRLIPGNTTSYTREISAEYLPSIDYKVSAFVGGYGCDTNARKVSSSQWGDLVINRAKSVKEIKASSTYGQYSIEKINDGDRNTTVGDNFSWTNALNTAVGKQSVKLVWENPVSMSSIILFTSSGYKIKEYDIEYHDGYNWVPIAKVRQNTDTVIERSFNNIMTDRIMISNMRGPDHQSIYARINEIEIYNGHNSDNMDSDNDGITNSIDECPNTSGGVQVYANGCEILDSDNDGVLDDRDQCPNTSSGLQVNSRGCFDLDNDGVHDSVDQCPDSNPGVLVDSNGCQLLDSDDDGVFDNVDQCPNTPYGARIDSNGCFNIHDNGYRSTWTGNLNQYITNGGTEIYLSSECINYEKIWLTLILDTSISQSSQGQIYLQGPLKFENVSSANAFTGDIYLDDVSLMNNNEGTFNSFIIEDVDDYAMSTLSGQMYGDNLHTIFNNPWAMIGQSIIFAVDYQSCTP